MTLRTKSRGWQWLAWGGLVLVALAVAAVWSFLATGSVSAGYFHPAGNRLSLPYFALFAYLGWELRWDGVRRGRRKARGEEAPKREVEERRTKEDKQTVDATARRVRTGTRPPLSQTRRAAASTKECVRHPLNSTPSSNANSVVDASATGEELFNQARNLPHRVIPSFRKDGPYLDLLGKSAQKGYAPALSKLGEYAMRRGAWVEAYYWMKLAQRQGLGNAEVILRKIRKHWSQEGFPKQSSNVSRLFTAEAGFLGRALLSVDSGHEAARAKEYLKANHPEFLDHLKMSPSESQSCAVEGRRASQNGPCAGTC